MASKRLSQLEAFDIFSLVHGTITRAREEHLVKRGLAERQGGRVVLSKEGADAFRKWSGGTDPKTMFTQGMFAKK